MRTTPRTLRLVPLLVALALLAAACGSGSSKAGDDSGADTSSAEVGGLVSAKADRAKAGIDEAEAGAVPVQAFAVDAYGQLAADPANDGKNLVFSPYSIEVALAMARAGAKGQTASEMDTVLHAPADGDLGQGLNGLDQHLEDLNGTKQDGDRKGTISLKTANALWGQQGDRFEQPFLDQLATQFGAGMHTVDYAEDTEGARKQINAWVADNTGDRIKDLLGKEDLDPLTRLVLTNAIYLKAPWASEFGDAQPADFHLLDGSTTNADLMATSGHLDYSEGDGYQAVTIPYLGGDLAMTVVVPATGQLSAVEGSLADGGLAAVLGAGSEREVDLKLPKFDLSTRTSLAELLKALGMPLAFEQGKADFTGMSADDGLYIGDVLHEANITVDEKGTEASAATAVVMEATGAPVEPEPPVELNVDRPFLFVVHDTRTGTPLFLGRVTDPTQK